MSTPTAERERVAHQIPPQRRDLQIGRCWRGTEDGQRAAEGGAEERYVELSFSSEEPAEQFDWWEGETYLEVLDHAPESVRLDRIRTAGISLFNHNMDAPVARPVRVWLEDRRGKAVLRFGRTDRANEIWSLIEDGILTNVSVWYRIHRRELEREEKGKPKTYRVTDWEPIEIGPVSVPADATVGIGRSADLTGTNEAITLGTPREEVRVMEDQNAVAPAEPRVQQIDEQRLRAEIRSQEQARVAEIMAGAQRWGLEELAREHIQRGTPLDAWRQVALEALEQRNVLINPDNPPQPKQRSLGLNRREIEGFSLLRLAAAMAYPGEFSRAAGFEMEASTEWGKVIGKPGMFIPPECLRSFGNVPGYVHAGRAGRRAITDTAEGADMTPISHLGDQFVEILRSARPVTAAATLLSGLTGDILIPTRSAGGTAAFKAEVTAASETTPTFGQLTASPKKLTAYTELAKQAMVQFNPSLEGLTRFDLLEAGADKLEGVMIDGGGTAEPSGILDKAGIGSVEAGNDSISWATVVGLEKEVDTDNALMGRLAYLTNSVVRAQMKIKEVSTQSAGRFIWERGVANPVNDYPCLVTNKVLSTYGTGTNRAACIFGNFADLLLCVWDSVELVVNPYIKDTEAIVRMTMIQWVDVVVRRAESFAACTDIDYTVGF